MSNCDCETCERNRRFAEIIFKLDGAERQYMMDVFSHLITVEWIAAADEATSNPDEEALLWQFLYDYWDEYNEYCRMCGNEQQDMVLKHEDWCLVPRAILKSAARQAGE